MNTILRCYFALGLVGYVLAHPVGRAVVGKVRIIRSPHPPLRDYGGYNGYGRPGFASPPQFNPSPPFYGGNRGFSQLPHGHGRPPLNPGYGPSKPNFSNSQSSASASSNSYGGGFGQGSSSASASSSSSNSGRPGFGQSSSHAQSESGTINFGPLQATFSKSQSNSSLKSGK